MINHKLYSNKDTFDNIIKQIYYFLTNNKKSFPLNDSTFHDCHIFFKEINALYTCILIFQSTFLSADKIYWLVLVFSINRKKQTPEELINYHRCISTFQQQDSWKHLAREAWLLHNTLNHKFVILCINASCVCGNKKLCSTGSPWQAIWAYSSNEYRWLMGTKLVNCYLTKVDFLQEAKYVWEVDVHLFAL